LGSINKEKLMPARKSNKTAKKSTGKRTTKKAKDRSAAVVQSLDEPQVIFKNGKVIITGGQIIRQVRDKAKIPRQMQAKKTYSAIVTIYKKRGRAETSDGSDMVVDVRC
jgi:hypothetical protein